jgi:hypothetical protein
MRLLVKILFTMVLIVAATIAVTYVILGIESSSLAAFARYASGFLLMIGAESISLYFIVAEPKDVEDVL